MILPPIILPKSSSSNDFVIHHSVKIFSSNHSAMTTLTPRSGTTEKRLEPGEPGRELEQRRCVELPGGQPQQERPRQPQRQPGFPSCEHGPVPCPGHPGHHRGKDNGRSHPSHPVSRVAGTKPPAAPPPVIPADHRGEAATAPLEVECSKLNVQRSECVVDDNALETE